MNALIFLIETFARLYLLCFLLRLLLQVARADFYHPIPQFIVQVTNPLVVPARRVIPSVRRFDLPTLVVLAVLQMAVLVVILTLAGTTPGPGILFALTVHRLLSMTLWVYIVCIFVWVILSWVQASYAPMGRFLGQLIEPVLRPARRLLPPVGGFDISPLIVTIMLFAAIIALDDLFLSLIR